ncbi:hypothetical protein Q664_02875 [Archangium violaceum Cb vi76]|uniref:Protein kinase domain-containing protein n=1 Tax=Archangium violaceum Cb vi76 TaxID=1406225 RepID=A0A084T188_9BACT|nr:hypothetical protein Q664_02875 [Archangium violaceum Cb vi76]
MPVLVDFGIGWLAEEPPLTHGPLPPCTAEYRSPEALRFARAHTGGQARYVADAGDELWALGVILYWLLTAEDPANKVRIPGHKGPHPREYHEEVFERLGKAVRNCETTVQCQEALTQELKLLAEQIRTVGSRLNKRVTRTQ